MVILFFLFIIGFLGHVVTYRRMQGFWKAYLDERESHRETLLNYRALYEEANRHSKRNGLGELPKPEELDEKIKTILENETHLDVDSFLGSIKLSRRNH